MKHLTPALTLLLLTSVVSCAHTPTPEPKRGLDCVAYNPVLGTCMAYAPEPPAGGRKCDSRGNTTINAGELAVYTLANYNIASGWCITLPGGYYPSLGMMQGYKVNSIKNLRTGWPAPPVSVGYSGTNYTGSVMSLPNGSYPSLSFQPASIKVN